MNDGGPAFPVSIENRDGSANTYSGMTLRDWMAGQALAGQWTGRESDFVKLEQPTAIRVAESAYRIADAMLAERERK